MTPPGDGARGKGGQLVSTDVDGAGIDKVLRDAVDSGAVPHVAAIAADRDGVIYQGAAGPRAVGEDAPVSTDTLFRLMSMTKMPATVVALQEMEKGNLDLDAPVVNYCPEFDEVQVLTGFDGGTPRFRPPASQATVRQLITHTSGLGLLVLERRPGAVGKAHRHPQRGGRGEGVAAGTDGRRSGHRVHLRHQH